MPFKWDDQTDKLLLVMAMGRTVSFDKKGPFCAEVSEALLRIYGHEITPNAVREAFSVFLQEVLCPYFPLTRFLDPHYFTSVLFRSLYPAFTQPSVNLPSTFLLPNSIHLFQHNVYHPPFKVNIFHLHLHHASQRIHLHWVQMDRGG